MTANDNLAHSRQAPRRTQPAGFGWADIIGPFAVATVVGVVFLWLFNNGWRA